MVYCGIFTLILGMGQGLGLESVGFNIVSRNVQTGLRQGQEVGPIVSYCPSPISCTTPGTSPVQCK